jgi:hypothetical protein
MKLTNAVKVLLASTLIKKLSGEGCGDTGTPPPFIPTGEGFKANVPILILHTTTVHTVVDTNLKIQLSFPLLSIYLKIIS